MSSWFAEKREKPTKICLLRVSFGGPFQAASCFLFAVTAMPLVSPVIEEQEGSDSHWVCSCRRLFLSNLLRSVTSRTLVISESIVCVVGGWKYYQKHKSRQTGSNLAYCPMVLKPKQKDDNWSMVP